MSWNVVLFIYVLVTVVVTSHVLLTREKDYTDGAITSADVARLSEWAEDGHMPATAPVVAAPTVAADDPVVAPADTADLLPGEEEDYWEDLAESWEFPEVGKNSHNDWKKLPVIMIGDCKCDRNRALRGCGRRGKGKQKGGKHIDKKRLRRADTKAHLSLA